jgi:hypothetical protein
MRASFVIPLCYTFCDCGDLFVGCGEGDDLILSYFWHALGEYSGEKTEKYCRRKLLNCI